MNRVIAITFCTYIFAHALCQGYQEPSRSDHNNNDNDGHRKSMLGMLSKIIEINGTIDQVMNEGSTTESAFGRVWLNATERPSGICEIEEEVTEEIEVIERIPYQVEVEVWCWSIRCTEWETHYREEKHRKNVTQTRLVQSRLY